MAVSVVTPGTVEPVTLSEAKAHLRVDHADEDSAISAMLADARAEAEAATNLTLREQVVQLTLDRFAPVIHLPVWPVRSVDQVAYDDADGAEQVLPADRWTWVRSRRPNLLSPAHGDSWPTPRLHWDAVRITLSVGWAPAEVPGDIRRAILTMTARTYEHREDTVVGATVAEMPNTRRLLARHAFRAEAP